jgi:hypothetical protein
MSADQRIAIWCQLALRMAEFLTVTYLAAVARKTPVLGRASHPPDRLTLQIPLRTLKNGASESDRASDLRRRRRAISRS